MSFDLKLQRRTDRIVWAASLAFAGIACHQAFAAPPDTYARECGDCHVAYAPRLLSAPEWRRVINGLDRHYGVDASLDAATTAALGRWLEADARPARQVATTGAATATAATAAAMSSPNTATPAGKAAAPLPRITTRPWFLREHGEIDARSWKLPAIGSPSNCGACHTDATRGRYDENALRLPAGVISTEEDEEHERHESRRR